MIKLSHMEWTYVIIICIVGGSFVLGNYIHKFAIKKWPKKPEEKDDE